MGISSRSWRELPVAVVDVETTGLHPAGDRIVEIAVVRLEPGSKEPRIALDTLVNPGRRMSATEIHGITDDDVRDAPTFPAIAPAVVQALHGALFASYNVYFDAKFVGAELERVGHRQFPPHLCLMYMRPLLAIGSRCTLDDACREHGVPRAGSHMAAEDALASARLWLHYAVYMERLRLATFADLAARRSYKFARSFSDDPIEAPAAVAVSPAFKSRRTGGGIARTLEPNARDGRAEYWDALKAALADLQVGPDETEYLEKKRRDLDLSEAEIRGLHARAFAGILADVTDDQLIDDREVARLASMAEALRRLGWAPGAAGVGAADVAPRPAAATSPHPRGLFAQIFGR